MRPFRFILLCAFFLSLAGCAQAAPEAKGKVAKVAFDVPLYERKRDVWVRTPSVAADSANLLIVFDGAQYREDMPLPRLLDSLEAAGKIPPTVAVLIDDGGGPARAADLANRRSFANWLCDDLVPWARAHYPVSRDRRKTFAYGSSMGGLAAAFVAFDRPDVVGVALSQSGAFWRNKEAEGSPPWEWLTTEVKNRPKVDARFVLDVGALETHGVLGGAGPPILEANRHLVDAMKAKGYDVTYTEVQGGVHSPESWMARLPAMLAALNPPARRSAAARP